ncbi:DUF6090 family protein [Mangrovimonas sp. DI 80]|uniref:DUF6090 family protein n=1 Tax=Mangrovimonas sp. DI 80 TaxID=1779330 RepID=UPI0009782D1F|nr:DUF6090 family protein [Mangrovimonas sp. DI 80]OMP32348.1 hypothetical protein BKM32_04665 [Mangrovimonas sp. DI 80]
MITFFRNIRQNLLSEGRTAKYLKYAIGEIILVVIGILIALQINTWQQHHKDRLTERDLLNRIKVDLENDIKGFEDIKAFKQTQNITCLRLLDFYIHPTEQAYDTIQFLNDIHFAQYFTLPNYHRTSYETSVSTGNILKIANQKLATDISNYYNDIELEQHVSDTKRFINAFVEQNLITKYRLSSKYINALDGLGGKYMMERYQNDQRPVLQVKDITNDVSLENYLNDLSIRLIIGIKYLEAEQQWGQQLIDTINNYLNEQ